MEKYKERKYLSIFFAIAIVPIIGLLFLQDIERRNMYIYAYLYLVLTIVMLFLSRFKIISAVGLFSFSYITTIGLSPIFKYITTKSYSDNQYALILGGYALFLCGYFIRIKRNPHKSSKIDKKVKSSNIYTMKVLCFILIIISIFACIIYATKNRVYLFGDDLESGRITALSGNGVLVQAIYLGTIAIYILFEMVLNKKFSWKIFALLFLVVIATNLVIGFRSRIIVPIIVMTIMYHKKNKINIKKAIILGTILLVFGAGYGILRGNSNTNLIQYVFNYLSIGSKNLGYILAQFPISTGYQNGYTYIINILMLAPGPDLDFTLWLKEKLFMNFSGGGVTPTIIGEFYINFGFWGVMLGMFVIGKITKKVDDSYTKLDNIFISSYMVSIMSSIVSGGIANIEINLMITVLVYQVLLYASKILRIKREYTIEENDLLCVDVGEDK